MKRLLLLLYAFFLIAPVAVHAQNGQLEPTFDGNLDLQPTDVIFWDVNNAEVGPNNQITVGVRLRTEQNFTLYKKHVKFKGPAGFQVSKVEAPPTHEIIDPVGGEKVEVYGGGDFLVTFAGFEAPASDTFDFSVTYLGCTERICLFPFTQPLSATLIQAASPSPSLANFSDEAPTSNEPALAQGLSSDDWQQDLAGKLERGELSLALLFLGLFLGGLATNLTPCVFPMIPITVRILSKRGETPLVSSIMYAVGIIATYSLLGILVSLSGGLFGALLANTYVNVFFVAIFVVMGFTMLGFGNLSGLQQLGSRLGSGSSSHTGTLLMGAGAGLVAAPCTGPILGALIAFTAKNPQLGQSGWQFFTYSFGFALPYVFLGMAAGRVTRLSVAPWIQNAIKLMFAAIMFGLAFYYLRIPLHSVLKDQNVPWLSLASGTAVIGLPLLVFAIISPRWQARKGLQLIPALLLGISVASASQWLTGTPSAQSDIEITWLKTIEEGQALASESGKPLLIDGWAEWCEACKKMDVTTYQDATLRQKLADEWILVKLDFTDLDEAKEKLAEKYGMQGLPTVVLLPSDGNLEKMKKITGYATATRLLQEMAEFRGQ